MKNPFLRLFASILTITSLLLLNSCAGVRLKSIPAPPPTAKLRVYVQLISAPFPFPGGVGAWEASHKEFAAKQIGHIEQLLRQTDIYEVVPEQDVNEVLGSQIPSYIEMTKNNWTLTREIGKALYAEYVFVIERRADSSRIGTKDRYYSINLINTRSGKLFEVSARLDIFDNASSERRSDIFKKLYSTVFLSAKKDMLETAIKKSENMYSQDKEIASAPKPQTPVIQQAPETKPQAPVKEKQAIPSKPELIEAVTKPESPATVPAPEIKSQAPPKAPEKQITSPEPKPKAIPKHEPKPIAAVPKTEPQATPQAPKAIPQAQPTVPEKPITTPEPKLITAAPKSEQAKPPNAVPAKPQQEDISGMYKLVIYDLNAPEQFKTVALIITEVLREELFLLNKFILVNRENLLDVNREMALQQSGLIDEKQAVKTGKGLAANQVVTGSLGILGKTFFLQAKRIDVETFATLGMASTRFAKGEEEDLLGRLPGLAKSLAGMR